MKCIRVCLLVLYFTLYVFANAGAAPAELAALFEAYWLDKDNPRIAPEFREFLGRAGNDKIEAAKRFMYYVINNNRGLLTNNISESLARIENQYNLARAPRRPGTIGLGLANLPVPGNPGNAMALDNFERYHRSFDRYSGTLVQFFGTRGTRIISIRGLSANDIRITTNNVPFERLLGEFSNRISGQTARGFHDFLTNVETVRLGSMDLERARLSVQMEIGRPPTSGDMVHYYNRFTSPNRGGLPPQFFTGIDLVHIERIIDIRQVKLSCPLTP